jgi:putative salt-induced outer membrane protein
MNMLKRILPALCLLPLLSFAAQGEDAEAGVWTGQGELGFTSTSGNTDSQNLNARLSLSRQKQQWRHSASIDVIQAKTDGIKSADSREFRWRSEYGFSEKSYAYGQARYQQDKFAGFDHVASLVAGLGSRFIETERHLLDLSAGVGYRDTKDSEFGVTTNSAIIASDLAYQYRFSETATFDQAILVEAGEDNTYIQSDTALRARINSKLSSKIGYQIKHNTDVTPSVENTDRIVTVALVYDF